MVRSHWMPHAYKVNVRMRVDVKLASLPRALHQSDLLGTTLRHPISAVNETHQTQSWYWPELEGDQAGPQAGCCLEDPHTTALASSAFPQHVQCSPLFWRRTDEYSQVVFISSFPTINPNKHKWACCAERTFHAAFVVNAPLDPFNLICALWWTQSFSAAGL